VIKSSLVPISNGYSTSFPGSNENPLSQSGEWAKAANSWQAIRKVSNVAKATAYNDTTTDDNYSLCQVIAPNDAEVIATVYRQNSTFAELELLLRMSDTAGSPGTAAGYECLCNTDGGIQIVRWNGGLGSFDPIDGGTINSPGSLASGNQLRATVVGSTINFYHRPDTGSSWTILATATDSTFATGRCGVGFYVHASGGNIDDVGFSTFTLNPL